MSRFDGAGAHRWAKLESRSDDPARHTDVAVPTELVSVARCLTATDAISCALLLALAGCAQDMADQPRYEPLEASVASIHAGDALETSSRAPPAGAVARGQLRIDEHFYRGTIEGKPATSLPMPVDDALLRRGRERYEVFCAPCHGRTGDGEGMVVRRGFPRPPSYHVDRLRAAPPGHIFDVITRGLGRMPDHAAQIPPEQRWQIVAYVQTLQLSRHAERGQLSEADIARLNAAVPP